MSAVECITDSSRTSRHVRVVPNCDIEARHDKMLSVSKLGPLAVRRPVPLAEPSSVFRHLRALRLRRMTLAC
jgi:hypothetical protein